MHKSLNKRQELLLAYIKSKEGVATREALVYLQGFFGAVSRPTVSRDLDVLVGEEQVERRGQGRNVIYVARRQSNFSDSEVRRAYFRMDPEERDIHKTFNLSVFQTPMSILTEAEKKYCQKLQEVYQAKRALLPDDIIRRETERLVIDFSWKSSQIEGNTYSLLETEELLKNKQEASGHTHEEAVMILNHKATLEYITNNQEAYQKLSVAKIEDIHSLLVQGLGINQGLRKHLVRISGTAYTPLDNVFQIREALEQTCAHINQTENVFEKAILALLLIAYIQPFSDGNKRTSRLTSSALLLACGAPVLSYRSMDEGEYKKAVLLFYEQQDTVYFKQLFIKQLEFAVENYF
jgi:Fic family protein/DNA-binding transcriptional ArsR family regulator